MMFSIPFFIPPSLSLLLDALGFIVIIALLGWLWSVWRQNVNLVDSLWSLLFLGAASLYAWPSLHDPRTQLILLLIAAWALRLSLHLLRRNWGHTEDRRYAAMRERNPPFAWRSLYIVFGLQGALAWIIALPLFYAVQPSTALAGDFSLIEILGLSLWSIGFLFESIADAQLHRFRQDPNNRGRVLDRGLWRYSRHPNYFGEACIAWGIYLLAIPAGGAWTIFAPALMTLLLLKVSGVSLLEADIHERRPAYRDYIARTSAFLPRPPRKLEPM
jgi:steroid 5-alpha reductase family enzyme